MVAGLKQLHQVAKPNLTPIAEEKQGQDGAAGWIWRESCREESSNKEEDGRRAVLEALNMHAFKKVCNKYTLGDEDREAVGRELGAWRFLGRQMMWNAAEWAWAERRLEDSLDEEEEGEEEEGEGEESEGEEEEEEG